VEVKGGVFITCLKVKQQPVKSKTSWKYDYYAPEVGLILTNTATKRRETRIAELLSYQMAGESSSFIARKVSRLRSLMGRVKNWFKKEKSTGL